MKKAIILITSILIGMILVTYITHVPFPKTSPDEITFIALPSPPKYKVINRSEDIQFLFDELSSLSLKPILNTAKGWELWLKYKGGEIVIIADKIQINGRWFKSTEDVVSIFHEFYQKMDYPESDWKFKN